VTRLFSYQVAAHVRDGGLRILLRSDEHAPLPVHVVTPSRRKSRAGFSRLALERPYLFVFPAISAIAAVVGAHSVRYRRDGVPFYMVALIFAAAFGTLAISFWPYMIPFSMTIDEAAAPHASLAFMFWGAGLFIFPLMLLYTVFSGKIRRSADHRH
jgi:cytochrome bd-type quinol oxidase subunit 2